MKKQLFNTNLYIAVPYLVSLCLFLANMMFPLKYLPRVLFGDSATLISIVVGGGTGVASTVHFALLRFIGSSVMSPFIEADLKPFTELDKHFGSCTINFFLSILLADMNLPCANNMKYRWNSSRAFSSDFHRYFSNSTIIETQNISARIFNAKSYPFVLCSASFCTYFSNVKSHILRLVDSFSC